MNRLLIPAGLALLANGCSAPGDHRPNILFVMMDDLGYGHFAPHNDTLSTGSFDPDFVRLMRNPVPDSLLKSRHHPNNRVEVYSTDDALAFSKRAMPTLTSLSKRGIMFTAAFSSNSLSAPSRISLATGMFPARLGVYENADCEQGGILPGTHLAEKLHDLGYATAHIGKWHVGKRNDQLVKDALQRHGIEENLSYNQLASRYPEVFRELRDGGYYGSVIDAHNPLRNGFDYYFGYNNWASQFYHSTLVWENYAHAGIQKDYNTDVFTDTAISFISKQVESNKPFYVQLHYHAVHDSLKPRAPEKYFSRFTSESYDLSNFYAHIFAVDSNIKKILNYLESHGALENTIIVFTSDNGAQSGGPSVLPGNAPFPGHKATYYQGGIRVPLVFCWPERIKNGFKSDMIVSTVDILPTLIEAAGGVAPDSIDGRSLYPVLLRKSDTPVHEYLYWAGMHSKHWGYSIEKSLRLDMQAAPPAFAILKDDYLLRFVGTIEPNLYADTPEGRGPVYSLYNIRTDPFERMDLIYEMPEKAEELKAIYKERSEHFLPPVKWSRSKWEEIMPN
jgi:uncharacterized sulfatase